ncbi:MAG TPA: hypothetical protein VN428_13900, partial [Bryobacteraceae bacterium]|nr:hypothetical protein [Bryobacteraceae bacterium]
MRLVCLRRISTHETLSQLSRWAVAACIYASLISGTAMAATFGTVVPLGGHTSDLALDEARQRVYVANFTANRIDVVSTATRKLVTSYNVGKQPASIALSPDGKYLVITHVTATGLGNDSLTVMDLEANTRRTYAFGSVPLGVAFMLDGKAFLLTTDQFLLFDPATGVSKVLGNVAASVTLPPQDAPCEPRQFIRASLAASGDGNRVWGIADAEGEGCEANESFVLFHYTRGFMGGLSTSYWTASPPEGPRVIATDRTGAFATSGWSLFHNRFFEVAEWINSSGLFEIGGYAIDSARGVVYGQVTKKGFTTPTIPGPINSADGPRLLIADADNLTVRDELKLQEHMSGRAVLDAAGDVMYAVSQSGLMILPVGSLAAQHRLAANQEDVLFRGNWCDRRTMTQDITISNPGGGKTPFTLSSSMPGVLLSATSGVTPARITVGIDTYTFRNNNGTAEGFINVQSDSAINVPPPIRVLVNNKEPDQRGTLFSVPGRLIDLQMDRARNRFYVTRQDKNEVLVFDSTNFRQVGTLRTATTPTNMAITPDNRYLIVGADNAQVANVYDLESMQFLRWIVFPAGHYPRSIAASNRAILAVSRLAGDFEDCSTAVIDHIDVANGFARPLSSLGVWKNCVDPSTALAASPSGAKILGAQPDGTVLLYDAQVDDFVAARKDLDKLEGAYGAVSDEQFVVGGLLFNSSLVPSQVFNGSGLTSGVVVSREMAMRTTAASAGNSGLVEHVNVADTGSSTAARLVEAPILPDATIVGRAFTRTLASTRDNNAYVLLSRSG